MCKYLLAFLCGGLLWSCTEESLAPHSAPAEAPAISDVQLQETYQTFYEEIVQPLREELGAHPGLLRVELADQHADAILAVLEKRQLIDRVALEQHGDELYKAILSTLRAHRTVTAETISRQLIKQYNALHQRPTDRLPVTQFRRGGTPCYDSYESSVEQATIGLIGCMLASGGVTGVAICSTVYAVGIILLDEDYEDCLANTY